mgnify:CR=1 FL=1
MNLKNANIALRSKEVDKAANAYLTLLRDTTEPTLKKIFEQNLSYIYYKEHKKSPVISGSPTIAILLDCTSKLNDVLRKVTFFYTGIPALNVLIYSETEITIPDTLTHDEDYDKNITCLFSTFRRQISVTKEFSQIESADYILCTTVSPKGNIKKHVEKLRKNGKKVYAVDKENQRHEGSFYNHSLYELYSYFDNVTSKNYQKFLKLRERLNKEKSYIFASGPSIEKYDEFDYNDGNRLICNTLTLNTEFMDKVKPDVLFFADPIFHYGPSIYAAEFRESVSLEMKKNDELTIISTSKYFYLLNLFFPEYQDRIICIPMQNPGNINLKISEEKSFFTRATDNIFTLLMLPFAANISKNISVIGIDGKPLSLTNKFWNYGKGSQNNDSYNSLKKLHPGFFNLDYNDFYLGHCDVVSKYVNACEYSGTKVNSLTKSYIPALSRRSLDKKTHIDKIQSKLASSIDESHSSRYLISLNPDLSSKTTGHFYNYDESIRLECKTKNIGFLSLTGKDLECDEDEEFYHPWFTHNSWVGSRPIDIYTETYEEELKSIFETVNRYPSKKFIFYFYMGTPWHLPKIKKILIDQSENIKCVINLFGADKYIDDWLDHEDTNEFTNNSKLTICVESERLFIEKNLANKNIKIWPMIRSDVDFSKKITYSDETTKTEDNKNKNKVFYACTPQIEKGFDVVLNAISDIPTSQRSNHKLRITKHLDGNNRLKSHYEKLISDKSARPIVHEGDLDPKEYEKMYTDSDIVVIPYTKKLFEYKTSGAILDAIYYGKPVIATKSTWPGDIVEKYNIGLTFEDGNHTDLNKKISHLFEIYDEKYSLLHRNRASILEDFSTKNLINFLLNNSGN